jgi:cobalt-zinc-cadmium efflux system outer membrane protein
MSPSPRWSPCLLLLVAATGLTTATRARAAPIVAPDDEGVPSRLTLAAALERARSRGLDVLAADAAIAGARGAVAQAGAIANPILGVGAGHSFGANTSCPGCSALSWSTSLTDPSAISDALWGKRAVRRQVADAALLAAQRDRRDAVRLVTFQVKRQYVELARARAALAFAREVQSVYAQVLDLTHVRLRAGAISEADVSKAETAKLEADQDLTAAEAAVDQAAIDLLFLLGVRRAAPAAFTIDEDVLRFRELPELRDADEARLLEDARRARPDLEAARYDETSAAAAASLARKQRLPDVGLTVQAAGEGTGRDAIQPPTLGVGITFAPPLLNRYRGEIARADAELAARKVATERIEAQITADVRGARRAFVAAHERVVRMESQLLGAARRARDLVRVQYDKGAASLLEFLDAQRTFIANNVEYLQDLADYWTAVFQLEQAVGSELLS